MSSMFHRAFKIEALIASVFDPLTKPDDAEVLIHFEAARVQSCVEYKIF